MDITAPKKKCKKCEEEKFLCEYTKWDPNMCSACRKIRAKKCWDNGVNGMVNKWSKNQGYYGNFEYSSNRPTNN